MKILRRVAVTELTHFNPFFTGALWSKPGAAEFQFLHLGFETQKNATFLQLKLRVFNQPPWGERMEH